MIFGFRDSKSKVSPEYQCVEHIENNQRDNNLDPVYPVVFVKFFAVASVDIVVTSSLLKRGALLLKSLLLQNKSIAGLFQLVNFLGSLFNWLF